MKRPFETIANAQDVSLANRLRGFEKVSDEEWGRAHLSMPLSVEAAITRAQIILPRRSTAHAAGYDIFSPWNVGLLAGESITIPTGFKSYMLPDEFLAIYPRSGLGFKYFVRLANTVGIGDSDYYNSKDNEGHYFVRLRNEGQKPIYLSIGEAFAQCIFQKYLLADGDDYIGNKRTGGFGSTSK